MSVFISTQTAVRIMNLALGAPFLYGAYQTWKVQSQSEEGKSEKNYSKKESFTQKNFYNQERILRFWVVMMSMLTVVPIFDICLGWIFGPLYIVLRLLIFWKVAYSRTLGSGYLFEQYEQYANYIENNIRQVILVGRRFRTALIDFLLTVVAKLFLISTEMLQFFISREMLSVAKVELKRINVALGNELDKVDRPGHKRKPRTAEDREAVDVLVGAGGTTRVMKTSQGEEEQKERVKTSREKVNKRTGLRRRKKEGYVK